MSTTVRQALVSLADALVNGGELAEADEHLARATVEPGDEPPGWVIAQRRADLAARRGDHALHVAQLLAVATDGPRAVADAAARDLAQELKGSEVEYARSIPPPTVEAFVKRTLADESPDLAAAAILVSLLRGENATALQVAEVLGAGVATSEPELQTLLVLDGVYRRLADGQATGALDVLSGLAPQRDPAVDAARAAVALGLGDAADAMERAPRPPLVFPAAVVRCLAALVLAARREGEHLLYYDVADEAAADAARLESGTEESLLLRAQVALERGTALSEARQLLESAVRRRPAVQDLWWWALQGHLRSDNRWKAAQIEVAAALDDDETVLGTYDALSEAWPPPDTTHSQDAGIAWAAGSALERRQRNVAAAEAYRRAAASLGVVTPTETAEQDRLTAVLEAAARLDPSATTHLDLAEHHLRQALSDDLDVVRPAAERGLAVLSIADAMDDVDADRAGYLRGLLLGRQAAVPEASVPARWAPLPHLLVAALSDDVEPYRAAHAALALDVIGQSYAAVHFAERALRTSRTETDAWLDEVAVVTRFNYFGVISEDSEQRLGSLDQAWAETVRGYAALLGDDIDRLGTLVSRMVVDAPWADLAKGCATLRCEGPEEARPIFTTMLAGTAGPQHKGQAALFLGDPIDALQRIEDGRQQGLIASDTADLLRSWCLVAQGDADGVSELREWTANKAEPFGVREVLTVLVPVLRAVYGDSAAVVTGLDELRVDAEQRLVVLEDPSRPLVGDDDIEAGPEVDRQVVHDVTCLLRTTDIVQRDGDGDAIELIAPLVEAHRGTPLGAAALVLSERLRARTVTA